MVRGRGNRYCSRSSDRPHAAFSCASLPRYGIAVTNLEAGHEGEDRVAVRLHFRQDDRAAAIALDYVNVDPALGPGSNRVLAAIGDAASAGRSGIPALRSSRRSSERMSSSARAPTRSYFPRLWLHCRLSGMTTIWTICYVSLAGVHESRCRLIPKSSTPVAEKSARVGAQAQDTLA